MVAIAVLVLYHLFCSQSMKRQKVLIAGGTGFLGKSLIRILKEKKIDYITTSLSMGVDFRDLEQTLGFFKKNKPDVVIHAGAYIGGIKFGLDHA